MALEHWLARGLDLTAACIDGVGTVVRSAKGLAGKAQKNGLVERGRFVPESPLATEPDSESLDAWGFKDTAFTLNSAGNVVLGGDRYDLCGQELPNLIPWMEDVLQLSIERKEIHESSYPTLVPDSRAGKGVVAILKSVFPGGSLTTDPLLRLRHGHGHTQSEMFAIKYGKIGRIPDVVVFPKVESQVGELVALAREHDLCLIPYGGGTNVSEALKCQNEEERIIVSVDVCGLNKILWIDPVNHMACIQAGAVGRNIVAQLAEHGFTMGHEPDSVEFSTLGGWIATHASGMKKNKYGNIEDIVLDFRMVTAEGVIERVGLSPRESTGVDLRKTAFGSEGNLGLITQATVKLFPLPALQRYGSVLFKDFDKGLDFLYELRRTGCLPASVRLVDNVQFQFSMALKPAKAGAEALKSKLEKIYATKLRGYSPDQMVACTIVFEGSEAEVRNQERQLYGIAEKHGGMKAGASNGEKGYQLTYSIAYIRDFVMNHYVLAESFETSVAWSQVRELCERVKERVHAEHIALGLPGLPFISCRVTQTYDTGVCVYFYLAYYYKDVDKPSEIYSKLEHAARDEVLLRGGSLSHHHGVGKLRSTFMERIESPDLSRLKLKVKESMDPGNVFGANNHMAPSQAN